MPEYRCPDRACKKVFYFDEKIGSGVSKTCPVCKRGTITKKNLHYNHNPYAGTSFAHYDRVVKKVQTQRVGVNRSLSAPPDGIIGTTPPYTTRVTSLTDPAWTNTTTLKIRLAYQDLDPANPGMQGLVIARPELATYAGRFGGGTLKAHFDAVADLMEANHKQVDATEGTGEAAAALGVLVNKSQGYRMLWGMNVHRGAGIDQIWGLPDSNNAGRYADYLVVEAKGPGQSLNVDPHRPQGIGSQMSHDWIIDNLARMAHAGHTLAGDILTAVGLTTHVPLHLKNYNGGSKSYYAVNTHTPSIQAATLHGMVVTAKWSSGYALSYTISGYTRHY